MKNKRFAFLSGRFGFLVLVLLTVAVIGAQVSPSPRPVREALNASATIRLHSAAERLQELEKLAHSVERRPGSVAAVEVSITQPDPEWQADVPD